MNHRYRFAQLFIRLSRFVSVLIVLVGLSYSGYRGFIRLTESNAARYKKSAVLDFKLEALEAEEGRAEQILKGAFPSSEDLKAYSSPSALQKGADSSLGFKNLMQSLAGFKAEIHELKSDTVSEYEHLIGKIRDKLLQHAQEIAGPKVSITKVSNAQASNTPTSTPAPTEKPTLYVDLGDSDMNQRRQNINGVSSYLRRLEKESEQPESKAILTRAATLVVKLGSLLVGPNRLQEQEVNAEPAPSTITKTRDDVKAEQVAEDLETSIAIVRQSILRSWKLDEALETAMETASEEENRCQTAEGESHVLMLKGIEEATVLAVQAVVLAFLILVMADFFQSQLDIAKNTGMLVERP